MSSQAPERSRAPVLSRDRGDLEQGGFDPGGSGLGGSGLGSFDPVGFDRGGFAYGDIEAGGLEQGAAGADQWATVPAYRLSAAGWEQLPAARELEAARRQGATGHGEASRGPGGPGPVSAPHRRQDPPRNLPLRRPKDGGQQESGPTVRVEIGRLELAPPPPPPSSEPPPPALGPTLPLLAYLRRRRGGRR